MAKRFFKLLYVLALIAIGLSLPIYLLNEIHPDEIVYTTYKAKCLSNNEYVVLQGALPNEVYVFNEFILNNGLQPEEMLEKDLNFYCKYYNEIQPFLTSYRESKTSFEQMQVNNKFVKFEDSKKSSVNSYPALYKLEIVDEIFQPGKIYGPVIAWFVGATLAFLLLQIIRICYVYVVFGKLVWHPFKIKNI